MLSSGMFAGSLSAWAKSVAGKQIEVQGGAYTEISVDELQSMLKNKDFRAGQCPHPI